MKINSALPKGDADGLSPLESVMLKKQKPIVALLILEPATVDEDLKTHEKSLKVAIRRIEALLPDDVETATRLIQRAFEARTGESTLPIELENDIKDALKGVDTYIPETPVAEVIDVPAGGYSKMTVPLLLNLLKKRGLNHTQATKTELIKRLEEADANNGEPAPTNVTSIFNDGSQPVPADAVDADAEWEAAAPEPDEEPPFDEDEELLDDDGDHPFNPAEYDEEHAPEDDEEA